MKDDYTTNSHYLILTHFSLKGWENVLFELGEKINVSDYQTFSICSQYFAFSDWKLRKQYFRAEGQISVHSLLISQRWHLRHLLLSSMDIRARTEAP